MTDTFKSFVDSMMIDISKPRTYEEATSAIERLAQQRMTPIPAEPVIITISTPTVWPADPHPPIEHEVEIAPGLFRSTTAAGHLLFRMPHVKPGR